MCKIGVFAPYRGFMSDINYSYSNNLYYGKLLGISETIEFHSTNAIKLYERYKEVIDEYIEYKESNNWFRVKNM